jgi:hypothetical protein
MEIRKDCARHAYLQCCHFLCDRASEPSNTSLSFIASKLADTDWRELMYSAQRTIPFLHVMRPGARRKTQDARRKGNLGSGHKVPGFIFPLA